MAFSDIPKIENYKLYIDAAFKKAQKISEKKAKTKQIKKINEVSSSLVNYLSLILKRFPSIDTLEPFYNELFKATIDYADAKRSLGSVLWAVKKIKSFHREYDKKLRITSEEKEKTLNSIRMEFYGRVNSVMKQIKTPLAILEDARRKIVSFPVIKTGMKTICIIGFPNVGKSTLLYKLTGSRAEIKPYAFTTKWVNVSYIDNLQIIDTPGILNRPSKTNVLELISYLSIKYLADLFIYVFDPSETYPLPEQIKLYNDIKDLGEKVIVYVSKRDICDLNVNELKKFHPLTVKQIQEELEIISEQDKKENKEKEEINEENQEEVNEENEKNYEEN